MKKTLLALLATSLLSGGALAAAGGTSDSFSVTWTGNIPLDDKAPTGWTLKDGDDPVTSLTKPLSITKSGSDLLLTSDSFTITAASNDTTALNALDVYLSDSSVDGLTPQAGADPVSLTFTVGGQAMQENEKGNSYTKEIAASGLGAVESIPVMFSGTVEADEWDANNDTSISISASFVITSGI